MLWSSSSVHLHESHLRTYVLLFLIGVYAVCCMYVYVSFSDSNDTSLIFNPPEVQDSNIVFIEFHCLLSAQHWGFHDSSQVFIRFKSNRLGDFKYCYGPMEKVLRFVCLKL